MRMSKTFSAQSGRQSNNAPIESWDLMWNWHSLTYCTQNNLSRSPLSSSTVSNDVAHSSCQKPIALPVWLAASSYCKRYSLTSYGLGMKSVYRRTTIQLAEPSGLCTSDNKKRYIDPSCLLRMSVWCPLRVTSGYNWTDIFCRPWGEGERPVLLRICDVLLSQQMLPAIKRVTERCFFTKQ